MPKLHLGCGSTIKKGWINVDLNNGDLKFDLRNPFPWKDNSIDYIYNEHFIEHLTHNEQNIFIDKCYNVLKIGGVIRIATPDLENLINKYLDGTLVKEKWTSKYTLCGAFNFAMYNNINDPHKYILDFNELKLKLNKFKSFYRCAYKISNYVDLNDLETRPPVQDSLIVEAQK